MFDNVVVTISEARPEGAHLLALTATPQIVRLVAHHIARERASKLDPTSSDYLIERARYETMRAIFDQADPALEWTDERIDQPSWLRQVTEAPDTSDDCEGGPESAT